jgi:hypothetical protein
MLRLFFFLIASGSALQAYGQLDSLMPERPVERSTPPLRMPPPIQQIQPVSMLKVQTDAWMYSQRMPAGMLYPFMGGSISNDIIRKSSDRIGDAQSQLQGQAGILVQFDDFARYLIPSKKISWSYQYAYTNLYCLSIRSTGVRSGVSRQRSFCWKNTRKPRPALQYHVLEPFGHSSYPASEEF